MIVQIRGTSGSGKTTAMRAVMYARGMVGWQAVSVVGRERPLYYRCLSPALPPTVVLGHYESPCGGCDTIGSARQVAALTAELQAATPGLVVLQEGLLLSEDVKWTAEMPDVRVLFLATPLETCLSQIQGRRAAAGNEKPFNETNTVRRFDVIERSRVRLLERGIWCRRVSAAQAPRVVLDLIRQATR